MSSVAVQKEQAATPEARARELSRRFLGASAEEVLGFAAKDGSLGPIALVSSFGAESAVLLHLIARVAPGTPVIFLDTGKHFAQTLSYRRKLTARLGLTDVRDIRPVPADEKAEDPQGDLWRRDADACCDLRKVRPLAGALEGFEAWITGRKAFHGGGRAHLPTFEWSGGRFKVNPLVTWSAKDVEAYRDEHELPAHPLVAQGYPSIGCWPCTMPVEEGADLRTGRWSGTGKVECGIHQG